MGTIDIAQLRKRFASISAVKFDETPGGLARITIAGSAAEATVYLQGAHVARYQLQGGKPVLFMSSKSFLERGKPIRGGVPICFPWFGTRAGDPTAPLHGFVRTMPWEVDSISTSGDGVAIVMTLAATPETRAIWDYDFALKYKITIGRALELALAVQNRDTKPMPFEEALHTYLAVGDVRAVSVDGLTKTTYLDKTDSMSRKHQDAAPIRIAAETDRVYLSTSSTASATVTDPANSRRLVVEKANSSTTVVWNPWVNKARAMQDFADLEWVQMICVETANAADNAITLAPGASHEMRATIRVQRV